MTVGFDTASTITDATLLKFASEGGKYIELYEKYATPQLVQHIFAHGLAIGLIDESTAERALAGYAAGKADAEAFLARIPAKLGQMPPSSVAVAWTNDMDATPAQQATVLEYGRGYKDGLAGKLRVRCYANGAICAAAKAAGLVDFTWDAGGNGMRGTRLYRPQADENQGVGDEAHLGLAISIDSDTAIDPTLPWAWHGQAILGTPVACPLPELSVAQAYLGLTADGVWGPATAAAFAAHYRQ